MYNLNTAQAGQIGDAANDVAGWYGLSNIYIDDIYPSYLGYNSNGVKCSANCVYSTQVFLATAPF